MIIINFKKLNKDAIIPNIANPYDAGIDFYSVERKVLWPNNRYLISTGLAWEPRFQKDYFSVDTPFQNYFKIYMKLFSRSGLASKNGIEVGAGVIDQDYRGEIKILVHNFSHEKFIIEKGSKFAQGIVYVIPHVNIVEVEEVSITVRNEKGFGSTGV